MKAVKLALTPPLLDWLRQDPAWNRFPRSWRIAQGWRAFWAGVNARQSAALSPESALALQDPVFIVGPWRSGTTVMHELLTAATGSATPLTWQCMNAPAFGLSNQPPAGQVIPRPMDGLAIGAFSPQEDEFAMLALGLDSAYRAFLMPHRIGELQHTLDPDYWRTNSSSWLPGWEAFLRTVVRTSAAPQPLILKSPNHSFRLAALLERFPHARLVWMARDPSDVFLSNRKMWHTMFDAHGLTGADAQALDLFLDRALRRCAQALDACVNQLPPTRLAVCNQKDLIEAPRAIVAAICERLQLPLNADAIALERAVALTRAGRIERYDATVPSVMHQGIAALADAQRIALTGPVAVTRPS
ncbi:MAG: hypothetical protein C0423_21650 [Methylibium sp.]|nr:hypothetical protein [Methylibium sp.]